MEVDIVAERRISNGNRGFKGVWIPSYIWLDSKLSIQEMVFLVEIESLDVSDKGCFASNKHFSDFFGLTSGRCSQIISSLQEKGYVDISFVYGKNQEIEKRVIRVLNKLNTPIKYSKGGYLENAKGSNTSLSNTNINKYIYSSNFDGYWSEYPKKTQKKKAFEQFKKKVTDEKSLNEFDKGFNNYLKYIQINKWYSPAELFRWIRDERYKDELDLTVKKDFRKSRIEKVPPHILEAPKVEDDFDDIVARADEVMRGRSHE